MLACALARVWGLDGYRFMTSDIRIAPRHIFEARILVRLCRHQWNSAVSGWARDLSESGLGAFVVEELKVGERVMLSVPLSPSGNEEITACVARQVGTTQYGFQFTALSPEQRAAIKTILEGQPDSA